MRLERIPIFSTKFGAAGGRPWHNFIAESFTPGKTTHWEELAQVPRRRRLTFPGWSGSIIPGLICGVRPATT